MQLFYTPDIALNNELPEEEAAHCLRVLRLSSGDKIELTDGKGSFYDAVIDSVTGKHCMVRIENSFSPQPLWKGHFHLAVAPTKNMERMEWLVEKATEIGVDEFSFLNCRFSERKVIKNERLEKIVVSAMKQSLKAVKPLLNPMTDFHKFVKMPFDGKKYIAHCYEGERHLLKEALRVGEDALVLIGPEGDFSTQEVEQALAAGFEPISLGRSRLRTETAALVACHTFYMINQL